MLNEVVVVGAARTAIGAFMGSLKDVPAVSLGVTAVKGALKRAGIDPSQVQEVIAGMVYKAGAKGNPARQVQLQVGIPLEGGAVTVDQQCASAMRAFEIAAHRIMLGKTEISVVLGLENMSRVPHLLFGSREGFRLGKADLEDGLLYDALIDPFTNYHMGVTAENLAEKYGISREEQDQLAFTSHVRAVEAMVQGKFKPEIEPVEVVTRKRKVVVDTDEGPRPDISLEKLATLRPVFKKDGTVTAGNASSINDGAAALVLMSAARAEALGVRPLAVVKGTATFGAPPEIMGIGPVKALPQALAEANLTLDQVDLFEINEAFAAQFLAVNRELKIPMDKVNVNGSGISLGHPVGCTGIRIIVTLLYEMERRGAGIGAASLCAGGGPAMAAVLARP